MLDRWFVVLQLSLLGCFDRGQLVRGFEAPKTAQRPANKPEPSQEPSQRREPASWFFCKSTPDPPPCAALPGRQLALPELRDFGAAPPTGCPRWSSGRSRPAAAGDRAVHVVVHRPFLTAARSRPLSVGSTDISPAHSAGWSSRWLSLGTASWHGQAGYR